MRLIGEFLLAVLFIGAFGYATMLVITEWIVQG